MNFMVYGTITLGIGKRNFTKMVDAETENSAKNQVYAVFGSKNGLKRNKIKIDKVEKA
ncbi:50S ribosomal protein L18a [Candidatus Micrarchaeota archaeon]|nr:50S ribosomal protein L18a [Candidatus Micrarchaeota archaeon]